MNPINKYTQKTACETSHKSFAGTPFSTHIVVLGRRKNFNPLSRNCPYHRQQLKTMGCPLLRDTNLNAALHCFDRRSSDKTVGWVRHENLVQMKAAN
ncbi:hypothetical protein TNCV_1366701 [Trichonephila clavipes]|nr:hypothetical protein TNCV_308651 [Trichonephila clavipes]GFX24291.1 hypothetical protein TNCV_1366701 [Trichonephila clavipes]